MSTVLRDTSAVTGHELIRRIIGLAHVKDITSITDIEARCYAERFCLTVGKTFIKTREKVNTGADFIDVLRSVEEDIL